MTQLRLYNAEMTKLESQKSHNSPKVTRMGSIIIHNYWQIPMAISLSPGSTLIPKSSDCNGHPKLEVFVGEKQIRHPVTLEWYSIQILVNFEFFKLS